MIFGSLVMLIGFLIMFGIISSAGTNEVTDLVISDS